VTVHNLVIVITDTINTSLSLLQYYIQSKLVITLVCMTHHLQD